jgi:hypothetical protein
MARNRKQSSSKSDSKEHGKRSSSRKSGSTKSHSSSSTRNGSDGGGSHLSKTTTDHQEIQRWAEQRGGIPACVKGTGDSEDTGIIRIEFPGTPNNREDKLQEINWDDFFEKFDDQGLALVYQEHTAGGEKSNFNKLVKRGNAKSARASH